MPGGIERAVVNTANLFAQQGNRVTLLILDEIRGSFYHILPGIEIIQMPLSFGITNEGNPVSRKLSMLSDVLKLRKVLRKIRPTCILTTEYPFTVATVLTGARSFADLYSWEHHHFNWVDKNSFWKHLCQFAYPRLKAVICLNEDEILYYRKFGQAFVIPNFISNPSGRMSDISTKQLLTIGRLIPRKGIDLLLLIAEKILTEHPDWTWKVIGDGELGSSVTTFINQHALQNRLLLKPPSENDLTEEYCQASIYVMTSRFEAFPMVLLEAMSHGLPCISFNCPSGPSRIITDQIDGLLVENGNISKMYESINNLIADEEKRKKMSVNAGRNITRFAPENIYSLWESIINKKGISDASIST